MRLGNHTRGQWGVYPALDGWAGVFCLERQIPALFRLVGDPELAEPRFADPIQRLVPENDEQVTVKMYLWFMDKPKEELLALGLANKVPIGVASTPAELIGREGLGCAARWSRSARRRSPAAPVRRLRLAGVRRHRRRGRVGAAVADGATGERGQLPLDGVRVARPDDDVGRAVRHAAPGRDGRRGHQGRVAVGVGQHPHAACRSRAWPSRGTRAYYFNAYNRDKRSLTLDLAQQRGPGRCSCGWSPTPTCVHRELPRRRARQARPRPPTCCAPPTRTSSSVSMAGVRQGGARRALRRLRAGHRADVRARLAHRLRRRRAVQDRHLLRRPGGRAVRRGGHRARPDRPRRRRGWAVHRPGPARGGDDADRRGVRRRARAATRSSTAAAATTASPRRACTARAARSSGSSISVRTDDEWRALCAVDRPSTTSPGCRSTSAAPATTSSTRRSAAWAATQRPQIAMEVLQAAGVAAGRVLDTGDDPGRPAPAAPRLLAPPAPPADDPLQAAGHHLAPGRRRHRSRGATRRCSASTTTRSSVGELGLTDDGPGGARRRPA